MAAMVGRGGWRVEVMVLDGRCCFRVTLYGSLYGGGLGRARGICKSVDELRELLGDAFPRLVDEAPAA